MNCDAVSGMEYWYVAVVARDWREKLVFACSKKVNTKVPEAKAFSMGCAVSKPNAV